MNYQYVVCKDEEAREVFDSLDEAMSYVDFYEDDSCWAIKEYGFEPETESGWYIRTVHRLSEGEKRFAIYDYEVGGADFGDCDTLEEAREYAEELAFKLRRDLSIIDRVNEEEIEVVKYKELV